jgi:hypothetical protein
MGNSCPKKAPQGGAFLNHGFVPESSDPGLPA